MVTTRLSDVTAIWNTNAFFAYIITVRLFKLDWELRKLLAVLLATFGVLAVVYGDAQQSEAPLSDHRKAQEASDATDSGKPTAALLGDLLTLCASFGFGLYQVLYKRHVALPLDQEFELGSSYAPLPESDDIPASELNEAGKEIDDLTYPPPFGLHANLMASGIGLVTFFFLWIMLPFLHYSGYERFRLPDDPTVVLSIAGIAASGLTFNVGMLVNDFSFCLSVLGLIYDHFLRPQALLGLWGPVVVSVGCLLTIVLVLLSDITVGQGVGVITPWNLAGSGGIVVAFGVLVYDMVQNPQPHN